MPQALLTEQFPSLPSWAAHNAQTRDYYFKEWGRAQFVERVLFETLSLLIFQCGMRWSTILAKRPHLREVFVGFNPEWVAQLGPVDVNRILEDPKVIRNRRKIEAIIANARATVQLNADGYQLADLVWERLDHPQWDNEKTLRRLLQRMRAAGYKHVGPKLLNSYLQAVGVNTAQTPGPLQAELMFHTRAV